MKYCHHLLLFIVFTFSSVSAASEASSNAGDEATSGHKRDRYDIDTDIENPRKPGRARLLSEDYFDDTASTASDDTSSHASPEAEGQEALEGKNESLEHASLDVVPLRSPTGSPLRRRTSAGSILREKTPLRSNEKSAPRLQNPGSNQSIHLSPKSPPLRTSAHRASAAPEESPVGLDLAASSAADMFKKMIASVTRPAQPLALPASGAGIASAFHATPGHGNAGSPSQAHVFASLISPKSTEDLTFLHEGPNINPWSGARLEAELIFSKISRKTFSLSDINTSKPIVAYIKIDNEKGIIDPLKVNIHAHINKHHQLIVTIWKKEIAFMPPFSKPHKSIAEANDKHDASYVVRQAYVTHPLGSYLMDGKGNHITTDIITFTLSLPPHFTISGLTYTIESCRTDYPYLILLMEKSPTPSSSEVEEASNLHSDKLKIAGK